MLRPEAMIRGTGVKEQYVGDVNDYRKYALLRLLGQSGLRLGVCWMLTPNDSRSDGNKLGYLDQSKQERHDPELFALLRRVRDESDTRRLILIEDSGTLSEAVFVNAIVPETLFERQLWFKRASTALAEGDLIFFDPDNGIEVGSVAKGRRNSSKYVYRDELAAAYRTGHSLLVYQHFQRKERGASFAMSPTISGASLSMPRSGRSGLRMSCSCWRSSHGTAPLCRRQRTMSAKPPIRASWTRR